MVEVSDIKDEESLEAWLNARPEATRQKDAVTLAHRAAMRVLPLYLTWIAGQSPKEGLTSLSILRAAMPSGVASNATTLQIERAADFARSAAASAASASTVASTAARSAYFSASAATSTRSVHSTARASADSAAYFSAAWFEISKDAERLVEAPGQPMGPLWSDPDTDPFIQDWTDALAFWQASPTDWSFWINWVNAIRTGTPQNLDMLTEIAIQENDFWTGTDAEVNGRIVEIVEKYDLLDQARAFQAEQRAITQTTATTEHRSHNQPPELVDTPVEISRAATIIWANIDEAVAELEKREPDKPRLAKIARSLLNAIAEVGKYCAKVGDTFVMAGAKAAGTAGGVFLINYLSDGRVMDFATRLLKYATGGN